MNPTYPYVAWRLQPSFKPVLVTITEMYHSWTAADQWVKSDKGSLHHIKDLFPTKEAAIEAGWERIHKEEAAIEKKVARINKCRAALAKAAEEAE
jgi:hypothetical protein